MDQVSARCPTGSRTSNTRLARQFRPRGDCQSTFLLPQGSRVWLPRDGLWVAAQVLDSDADATAVHADDDSIEHVPINSSLPRRNLEGEEASADLATLAHLDEPNILRGCALTLLDEHTPT